MSISLAYLRDWLLGPRSRAEELHAVRRQLVSLVRSDAASQTEIDLAVRLRRLREELSVRLGRVAACASCVRPRASRWSGGHCCSGNTLELFTEHELAALSLAGTSPLNLTAPRTEHEGCAFRSPSGCSLSAMHRPSICVSYMCRELEGELASRPDARDIVRLQRELRSTFDAFVACRRARIEASEFEKLVISLRVL